MQKDKIISNNKNEKKLLINQINILQRDIINLRNKNISLKKNDKNYVNYNEPKNNHNKIFDINSPQQQISSTASYTFKNALSCLEEISDHNKREINQKLKKRKREENNEDFIYEELNFKNKRVKI